jgi:FkbM family methyltransferase
MKRDNGLWVPDGDTGVLNRFPLIRGVPGYQFNRVEAAVKACRRGRRRAIDAGAHVGVWSLHLAHWFEVVEAFEPVPENFECLVGNVVALDLQCRVRARPYALSDRAGVIELGRVGDSSYGWSTLAADPVLSTASVTIDGFSWNDVDLIKVDVEGHEFEVLAGAADTIRRCRPVIIIEEKHDPSNLASAFLESIGMRATWRKKHDVLFEWK